MYRTFIRNIIWDIRKKMNLCGNTIKETKLGNYTISLDINDQIQRSIYFKEFEPDETKWLSNILKPGMVVVDAGCNIGYYSLISSSIIGNSGLVYSFDPSEYAYKKLSETIQKNKISNIKLFNVGLSDRIEERDLLLDATIDTHSPSFCYTNGYNYQNVKTISLGLVKLITLDQFAIENNIDFIDLIKIDVEGYEPNLLRGMHSLLGQNKVHMILIESYGNFLIRNKSSPKELDALIKSYGFIVKYSKLYRCRPDEISLENFLYINPKVR